jgi:uncharacterized membrane protein
METNNSQMFNLKLEKGYLVAVAIALILVSCIIGGYFIYASMSSGPSGYSQMYLLDAQSSASNYPQVLIANHNSTFNQQVFVANNMSERMDYQLQVKIVQDTVSFPVDAPANNTYQFSLDAGKSWSNQVPISINQPGTYSVVFELYAKNGEEYVFTNNYCVLHLTVVAGSV